MPSKQPEFYLKSPAHRLIFGLNNSLKNTIAQSEERGVNIGEIHLRILLAVKARNSVVPWATKREVFQILKKFKWPIKSYSHLNSQVNYLLHNGYLSKLGVAKPFHPLKFCLSIKGDQVLKSLTQELHKILL